MTVLKATFHTHAEGQPVEIKLSWHKQLAPHCSHGGYTASENGATVYASPDHDAALRHAVRLYRKYEKQANERAAKWLAEIKEKNQ